MTLLDANVILRYITGDEPSKKARCEQFFNAVAKGDQQVFVTSLCFAEVAWVLDRLYHYPKEAVVAVLRRLLHTKGIELTEREIWLEAVDLYEGHRMSLIDAYHAAFMNLHAVPTIISYDTDFDELTDIKRREP